jgi:RNA polymerase sigma-70 factor (ECF subfamily)
MSLLETSHRPAALPLFADAALAREDERLLADAGAGSSDALAGLLDRHGSSLLGTIARIVGHHGEAEEVLQEVFLWVWEHADRFDARRCTVRGWLLVIARSRALDVLRSDRSRTAREEGVERERPRAHEPAPLLVLEEGERRRRLLAALALLPGEQRQCIELAFFAGLSHSQIASRLGQPLGTVKSRIQLGMGKLRGSLQAAGIAGFPSALAH